MSLSNAGWTLWRELEVELDYSEPTAQEPFFARQRDRFALTPDEVSGVEQLASGVWLLKPNETDLSLLHETTAGHASIVRLADVATIPLMTEVPMQRQYSELTGLTYDASVAASGDHFMLLRVPAGTTWTQGVITSTPSPTLSPSPRLPMQRLVESKTGASNGIDLEDQGYVIRWWHPGAALGYIDYLWSFLFGGPVSPSGYGQFCLTIGGAGKAKLHEYISGAWALVDEWTWAPAELIPARMHTMRIIPHAARWIEFRSSVTDTARSAGRQTAHRPTGLHGDEARPHAHLYEAKNRGDLPRRQGHVFYPMTGPGQFKFDTRQDARFPFQITRITYPTTGYLVDAPFRLPNTPGTLHALEVIMRAVVRRTLRTDTQQGEVVAQPIDASSDVNLSTQTETYTEGGTSKTIHGWQCPTSPHAVKVKLTFNNLDGITHVSPWLLGYECRRRGEFATPATTPILINDTHRRQSPVTRLEIDQGDTDPAHGRASLRIADFVKRVERLRLRGEMPLRVTTTYDRADQTKKAVIFEGYAVKPEGTLRGNQAGVLYPDPDWYDLRVECAGKAHRISKRDWPKQTLSLAWDDAAPADPDNPGSKLPYKVTDAVRLLLQTAGVPDQMLDIPDLAMRFWTNGDPDQEHLQIEVGTPILEFVKAILADYLNYFLQWDANAGSAGMWRVKPAPKLADAVLWNYQSTHPGAGKLVTHPGSYAASTTFMDHFESWPLAALGNWLQVTANLGNAEGRHYTLQVRNPLSYNRPGETTADPDDPDYLGYLSPLYRRIDGRLTTPAAAKFVARVTFERVCRGQRYGRLISPAVLIDAATAEPTIYTTHARRPHLYGDHITIDGEDWFVLGCRWDVKKKHMQTQILDVMRFNQPLSYS